MSTVEILVANRTPLELAKELMAVVKHNADLKRLVLQLQIENFWLKAAERPAPHATLQQSFDTIDAMRLRRKERLLAEEQTHFVEHRGIKHQDG